MKADHIIHLLLFIVIGILMFVVVVKLGSDATSCTLNPLQYGANQLKESNNKEINCQCNLVTENPSPTLHFNHNSSRFEKPLGSSSDVELDDFNFTTLQISSLVVRE